jgi:hypothetical protein
VFSISPPSISVFGKKFCNDQFTVRFAHTCKRFGFLIPFLLLFSYSSCLRFLAQFQKHF